MELLNDLRDLIRLIGFVKCIQVIDQCLLLWSEIQVDSGARDLSRFVGLPWPEDLGTELETVARRNIDMHFVFAADDPGKPLLHSQGGSAVPTLLKRGLLHIDVVDGPDHTFTPLWSQAALTRLLARYLDD